MKLYLLSQSANNGWDTYDSIVVCAEHEDDARTITPDGRPVAPYGLGQVWADHPEQITVRCIGKAAGNVKRGVILSSFNAG